MKQIQAERLTKEAFEPFGDVVEAPPFSGRGYFETDLRDSRATAKPRLWMLTKQPAGPLPLTIDMLERHEFSSQTFVPIDIGRWLIVVAPFATDGGPAVDRVRAFLAGPHQGVGYHRNIWHSGLYVFDRPARLSVFQWLDGTSSDEERVSVPPFVVTEAANGR
jgi:ureidoglycolate lyase